MTLCCDIDPLGLCFERCVFKCNCVCANALCRAGRSCGYLACCCDCFGLLVALVVCTSPCCGALVAVIGLCPGVGRCVPLMTLCCDIDPLGLCLERCVFKCNCVCANALCSAGRSCCYLACCCDCFGLLVALVVCTNSRCGALVAVIGLCPGIGWSVPLVTLCSDINILGLRLERCVGECRCVCANALCRAGRSSCYLACDSCVLTFLVAVVVCANSCCSALVAVIGLCPGVCRSVPLMTLCSDIDILGLRLERSVGERCRVCANALCRAGRSCGYLACCCDCFGLLEALVVCANSCCGALVACIGLCPCIGRSVPLVTCCVLVCVLVLVVTA